jgi:hypothetical protein
MVEVVEFRMVKVEVEVVLLMMLVGFQWVVVVNQ